jgi:hypothetical protein
MRVGRRLGGRGKHIQLVSQPIRLFPICTVSPPAHSTMASRAGCMMGMIVQETFSKLAFVGSVKSCSRCITVTPHRCNRDSLHLSMNQVEFRFRHHF